MSVRFTWRQEEGPPHPSLFDVNPLDPWGHVPSLNERGGQRSALHETFSRMSTVDRDVDQGRAADVHLSQPDRQ